MVPTSDSQTAPDSPLFDNRYRILQVIGGGGFGQVYLVEDKQRGRKKQIALKVLRMGVMDPKLAQEFRRYFDNEIEFMRTLQHPGIPRIINDGITADGENYFTLEFVSGRSLDEVLTEGAPDQGRVVRMLLEMLDVLDYAHNQEIIHRDLKPKNIMVTPDGHIRILDFGIGKILSDYRNRIGDRSIGIVGTPDYMSPEQVLGQPMDPATDLYSLGVVAYQMLTLGFPFKGASSNERMVERCNKAPVPLPKEVGSEALRNLVMQLLSQDKKDRPTIKDARETLRSLAAAEGFLPGPAVVDTRPNQDVPDPPRPKPWGGIAAGVGLVVLGLAAYALRCPLFGLCGGDVPLQVSILDQAGLAVPGIAIVEDASGDTLAVSSPIGPARIAIKPKRPTLRFIELAEKKCYDLPATFTPTQSNFDQESLLLRARKTCVTVPATPTLFIVSNVKARVSIDGVDTGKRAPAEFADIRPGQHRITLALGGYATLDTVITVEANTETTRVVADFRQPTPPPVFSRKYQISTSPSVAEVYVDGENTNSANDFGTFERTLSSGTHRFRVKSGTREIVISYLVAKGDPNRILVLDYEQGRVLARAQ